VPLTVDEYFEERTRIQNELWKKVPLMAGAGHLVKSLVRAFSMHDSRLAINLMDIVADAG
jgi:hypothetical protein